LTGIDGKQWGIRIVASVCLLLAFAVVVVIGRGFMVKDQFALTKAGSAYGVAISKGGICCTRTILTPLYGTLAEGQWEFTHTVYAAGYPAERTGGILARLGFVFAQSQKTSGPSSGGPAVLISAMGFACPLWFPLVLLLISPAIAIRSELKRRRHLAQPDVCRKCGYDLRASTNRCPECGTPISAAIDW